jgi:hypothetical protein
MECIHIVHVCLSVRTYIIIYVLVYIYLKYYYPNCERIFIPTPDDLLYYLFTIFDLFPVKAVTSVSCEIHSISNGCTDMFIWICLKIK